MKLQPGAHAAKIEVTIDAEALSWSVSSSGDYRCTVDAVVANLSRKGERLDYKVQSISGSIPAVKFRAFNPKSWVIPLEVHFNAQGARIRVVVRDNSTGKLGTADLVPKAPGTSSF